MQFSNKLVELKNERIFSFVSNDVIRVQELRRVEWNEYRWLEDGIEEGKPH